jgi:hypothetical protein
MSGNTLMKPFVQLIYTNKKYILFKRNHSPYKESVLHKVDIVEDKQQWGLSVLKAVQRLWK